MTTSSSVTAAAAEPLNKIALENQKQGNPKSEWGIEGDGDGNIQGFATDISTNIGGTVDFKIATDSTNYRIDIYRMGYYGGDGARKVASIDKTLETAQIQDHPIVNADLGLIDCGNWDVSASWEIPGDAVSGVYFAKLVREDGVSGESIIPFIVRDDGSTSDIVFQTSDTTWQAYNTWGGASLYEGDVPVDPNDMIGYLPPNCSCAVNAIGRASAVSYNRPIVTNTSPVGGTHDFIFGAESAAISWLEQNGYDVSYISGVDATRDGAQLLNHEAFLSVGHDEYWSAEQRENVEAARDSGVNLAFWSGNECYWKIRWENSIDGNGTPYRTMVCYKETWGTSTDPSNTGTGTWRDPRYADPGQEPENSLTGTMFTVDSYRQDAISIPYDFSNLRFWRNTDIADLQPGETFTLTENLLGYEWDSDVENGFRPAGLVNLSLSSIAVDTYLRDYGQSVGSAVATHSLTMYRAESGALVFGAGTVFWSWGLSSNHEEAQGSSGTPTDRNVQQAMINMFADMGIQPTTIDASLVLATQSLDELKPVSTITSPIVGASFVEGQHVTITGTAQDFGGGIIAGVEVSVDGGQRWFKATGRENWSFNWVVQASGTYTLMSRAVDDSVNLETPSTGKQFSVTLPSTSSLWTLAVTPPVETALDRESVEVGMRFQTTSAGAVTGIRFYKGFYNIGEHDVSLWTANGQLLATGLSTGESLSGWQTVTFSSPIQIAAGTTYVASYHTGGYYSMTDNYFSTSYSSGPIRVGQGAGVFAYGTDTVFPNTVFNNNNYWVDVVFQSSTVNTAPVASNDSLSIDQNASVGIAASLVLANDNDPDGDPLTVLSAGNATNGTVCYNAQTRIFSFKPTTGFHGAASFSYTITDGNGGTSSATVQLNVRPSSTAAGLFSTTDTPPTSANDDTNSAELGMKFVASTKGIISGIRFYKSAQDTGVHTGSLWTSTGALLATVTFTGETVSGWQQASFSQPITISANTTYVVSYHSNGNYMATANYFDTTRTNGNLSASSTGGNGVFAYGTSNQFPTQSFNSTNYWVDVLYEPSTQNAVPVAVPDDGFSTVAGTPLTIAGGVLLANDNDADGDTLTITGVSNAVNGAVAYNSATQSVTFTANAGYSGAASFSYAISDGQGGTSSAQVSLTVTPPSDTQSLFTSVQTPAIITVDDSNPVNLGMKFQADTAGWIESIRFYKSSANTGPHTGYLWSAGGELLASATFTNETTSGWQTVDLTSDVAISADTTYVVSYSTNGNYSATRDFFDNPLDSGNLHALSSALSGGNGVYAYGSSGLFPQASYNSTNYYVDVAFRPQLAA